MKRVVMGFVLGVAGLLSFANTAAACTSTCQSVAPACRRCVDTGSYTGQTCRNTAGACGCFYTNECLELTLAQSLGVEEADEAATCSAAPTEAAAVVEQ
jgi:hypothetical protein